MTSDKKANASRAGLHETFDREEEVTGSSDRGFGFVFAGLHESFDREEEVTGSSDRGFGFVFAGFFALVAIVRWWKEHGGAGWFAGAAVAMLALALIRPSLLAPFNRLWTKLALLLSKIMNPLIMGILFFLVVAPIGLLMRLTGKRPLALEFDPAAKSYWIERAPPAPLPGSMKNQF